MKKFSLLVLIILVLIAFISGFVYWLKYVETETGETPEIESETLMPVEPALPAEPPPLAE